jgi:hypothetical protein
VVALRSKSRCDLLFGPEKAISKPKVGQNLSNSKIWTHDSSHRPLGVCGERVVNLDRRNQRHRVANPVVLLEASHFFLFLLGSKLRPELQRSLALPRQALVFSDSPDRTVAIVATLLVGGFLAGLATFLRNWHKLKSKFGVKE